MFTFVHVYLLFVQCRWIVDAVFEVTNILVCLPIMLTMICITIRGILLVKFVTIILCVLCCQCNELSIASLHD